MNSAITMNLIAIVVLVGGWTAAVWTFYKRLSDPYARSGARRPDAVQAPGRRLPARARVLTGSGAA